jgi:hypothetical protein
MGDIPIPPGFWVYLKHLPKGTTVADLIEHLNTVGLQLPAECFAFREDEDNGSTCIVSIPRLMQLELVRWVLNSQDFQGKCKLSVQLFGTSKSKEGKY